MVLFNISYNVIYKCRLTLLLLSTAQNITLGNLRIFTMQVNGIDPQTHDPSWEITNN